MLITAPIAHPAGEKGLKPKCQAAWELLALRPAQKQISEGSVNICLFAEFCV